MSLCLDICITEKSKRRVTITSPFLLPGSDMFYTDWTDYLLVRTVSLIWRSIKCHKSRLGSQNSNGVGQIRRFLRGISHHYTQHNTSYNSYLLLCHRISEIPKRSGITHCILLFFLIKKADNTGPLDWNISHHQFNNMCG